MKRLFIILALLASWPAIASDIITATVTITNAVGTTNGQTITVNTAVRTWTNAVSVPGTQILTNATIGGAITNLFNQAANYPWAGVTIAHSGTNAMLLKSYPGAALAVTLSDGWGEVSLATNVLTDAALVRMPITVEPAASQTNIASGLVAAINNTANTNPILPTATAASLLVGTTNTQTIAGAKTFSSTTGIWSGIVSNATSISGTLYGMTNGYSTNMIADEMIVKSNLWFGFSGLVDGMQISFDDGAGPLRFTGESGWVALEIPWEDGTPVNIPSGVATTSYYYGNGINISNVNAANVVAGLVATNVTTKGATLQGTNIVSGQLAFTRKANTALANGNNAAVDVSTNVFVEVSGPGAAFAINGIAGGVDGRLVVLLNLTGYAMTIAHDSGVDPTAGNRIYSMTGADRATTGNGAATLIYNANASRWILLSIEQ